MPYGASALPRPACSNRRSGSARLVDLDSKRAYRAARAHQLRGSTLSQPRADFARFLARVKAMFGGQAVPRVAQALGVAASFVVALVLAKSVVAVYRGTGAAPGNTR